MADEVMEFVCVGKRLIERKGKSALAQGWLCPDGEIRYWTKALVPHASAGAVYEVHVDREGDRWSVTSSGEGSPRFIRREESDRVTAWVAVTHSHEQSHAKEAAERRINKEDPLRELVLDLRRFLDRGQNFASRYALIQAITGELHRPLTKEERDA